jgi:hypothetical protein
MSEEKKYEGICIAIKDGTMDDGDDFCYKGQEYRMIIEEGTEEEGGDWYYVEDELDIDNPFSSYEKLDIHGMDEEFFLEYFQKK